MPVYTHNEKLLYINQARRKIVAIAKAERPHIDRAEGYAKAYAQAMYDVSAITEPELATLIDDARMAAEDRAHHFMGIAAKQM